MDKIGREVTDDVDVHVILDNLSTRKTPAVREWLCATHGFHFHFAPTYESWMNLVEQWFSALTPRSSNAARTAASKRSPRIRDWVETWNDNPRPFTWHNSAEEILGRLAGYCRSLNK